MSNISLTFTKIDYIQEHAHVFVPYLVLNFFEKDFSKLSVSLAKVSCLDFKTLIPFFMSSLEKGSSTSG